MRFLHPFTRKTIPLDQLLPPALATQDVASTKPCPRLPEGSGPRTQHAGVPQAPAPLTYRQKIDQHIAISRASMLLREIGRLTGKFPLSYDEALAWLVIAEQAYNGERDTHLHALIAGTVHNDLLAYIATGRVL